MKETKGISAQLAPALVAIGTGLVAWNWYLKPEAAIAWAAALVLFVCMMVALFLAHRRWPREETRPASRAIQSAVVFAGLIMTLALAGKPAIALGIWGSEDLARRGPMVILGLFFMLSGNAMPKTLTPLASLQCDPAKVQAFQRFAGWTWVLTGLGYAMVWLLLPVGVAQPVSLALLVTGMLAVAAQVVRLRRSRPKVA